MPQKVPYKFYKSGKDIQMLAGTNVPYGKTEATQQEFTEYIKKDLPKWTDYYARNTTPGLKEAFQKVMAGEQDISSGISWGKDPISGEMGWGKWDDTQPSSYETYFQQQKAKGISPQQISQDWAKQQGISTAQPSGTLGAVGDTGEVITPTAPALGKELPFPKDQTQIKDYLKKKESGEYVFEKTPEYPNGKWFEKGTAIEKGDTTETLEQKISTTQAKIKNLTTQKAIKETQGEIDKLQKVVDTMKQMGVTDTDDLPANLIKDLDIPSIEEDLGISKTAPVISVSTDLDKQEKLDKAEKLEEYMKTLDEDKQEIEKLTVKQQLKTLREELGLDETGQPLEQPAIPQYESSWEALRDVRGVEALESRLTSINSQLRDMEASLRLGLQQIEGELAPMEILGQRQLELRRQGQEQLDALNREKATLVEELNMEYSLIETQMNLKEMDYETSRAAYDADFNTQLKLLDIIEGREEKALREESIQIDAAKANWQVMTKMIEGSGISYDDLSADVKTNIRKLELIQGLPEGFTSQIMANVNPEKEVMSKIVSDDKLQVSIIYEDGTVKTFATGLKAEVEEADIGWFEQLTSLNPDASREDLILAGKKEGLSTTDMNSVLNAAGILTKEKKEEAAKEQERKYTDEEIRQHIYKGYQVTDVGQAMTKSEIMRDIEALKDMSKSDIERAELIIGEIITPELEGILDKVNANPEKYRINKDGIFEIRWGPLKDKKIYSF